VELGLNGLTRINIDGGIFVLVKLTIVESGMPISERSLRVAMPERSLRGAMPYDFLKTVP